MVNLPQNSAGQQEAECHSDDLEVGVASADWVLLQTQQSLWVEDRRQQPTQAEEERERPHCNTAHRCHPDSPHPAAAQRVHNGQAAVQRYQAQEHHAGIDVHVKRVAHQLTRQLAIGPAMSTLEIEDPERQGEQLQQVWKQQIEDVDQLAASATGAAQVVQTPERQQVAGEAQRKDQAIYAGEAKGVSVQREAAAVIWHVCVVASPYMSMRMCPLWWEFLDVARWSYLSMIWIPQEPLWKMSRFALKLPLNQLTRHPESIQEGKKHLQSKKI